MYSIIKEDIHRMKTEIHTVSEDIINIQMRTDNKKEALRQNHL